VSGARSLSALSWTEVRDLDRARAVAVVPTAAVEQHGPHLPLDTDAFLCTSVVEAAAGRARGGPVVVVPTLQLGLSEHHMDFAGTLTLRPSTFGAVLADVCRSLARHDFRRQLVVNGHGGNRALIAETVQELGFEEPVHAAGVDYWSLGQEAAERVRESPDGGMAHACEFETSLMLHLRPESVRTELVAREIPTPRSPSERIDLFRRGPLAVHWKTRDLSRSGVMGAPDLASAEKGRILFEACADGLARLIEELRDVPLDDAGR
jgi:creatinine amidohydrolase